MSDKSFKDTMIYPIVFMLITCVVFVGILAVMYRSSEAKIEAYKQDTYQKLVLGLLAEPLATALETKPYHLMNDYKSTFASYIKDASIHGLERKIFAAAVRDSILGYCVDIGGKGLWGTMRALIALSPDMKTLKGLVVYDQMETPGLGARIGEQWFLDQFANIQFIRSDAVDGNYIHDFEFIPEGQKPANQYQIQQITGATITSTSVIRMIKNEMNLIYATKLKQAQL
jgi:Na+-transporting NADH:ubiquinone oxidoreductase subunit C